MPMYTYWCQCCDTDTEKMMSISERDNAICGVCGHRLVRSIDAPGAVYAPTSTGGMKV